MDKIKLCDIDFSSLTKLQQQGTKATLYRDNNSCYKILRGLYRNEKDNLYKKILDIDGIDIEGVLFPKQLIMQDNKLEGYIMDYFPNSMTLTDKFMTRYVDCQKLFDAIIKSSNILRNIHNSGIIYQDLSFENILVDKDGNVAFCDLDGCTYRENIGPFISILMKHFLIDYRKSKIKISDNLDRTSMLISFFYLIYDSEIQSIDAKKYSKLSDKLTTLENAKPYANMLISRSIPIRYVPYLDELIDVNDNLIYDRKEQSSFVKKLFKW